MQSSLSNTINKLANASVPLSFKFKLMKDGQFTTFDTMFVIKDANQLITIMDKYTTDDNLSKLAENPSIDAISNELSNLNHTMKLYQTPAMQIIVCHQNKKSKIIS